MNAKCVASSDVYAVKVLDVDVIDPSACFRHIDGEQKVFHGVTMPSLVINKDLIQNPGIHFRQVDDLSRIP